VEPVTLAGRLDLSLQELIAAEEVSIERG
jgi:hypothetical protein